MLGLSTKKYDAIGKLDPAAARRGKDEQQLGITYQGGPLAVEGDATRTLRAGDRAPDAVLRDAAGRETRLFELFRGPHFTAIAYGPQAGDELDRLAWPGAGAALKRIVIDGDAGFKGFSDAAGTFRKAYGVDGGTLLLVRPDGYLACVATTDRLLKAGRAIAPFTPRDAVQEPSSTRAPTAPTAPSTP